MAHIEATPRISTSVLNAYIRKKIEPVFHRSVLLSMMKSKGLITYNNDGKEIVWFPRFRRRDIVAGMGNPVSISFPQTATNKEARLPWRQYQMGESVTKFERLVGQKSETTIYKIYETAIDQMSRDFVDAFAPKLYGDGNATGSRDVHGFNSCMATDGVVTNSKAGKPNDLYANLYTTLGYYGGSWTGDTGDGWPTGTGDSIYRAWSPLIVDYANAGWGATTKTWPNTWQEVLNYAMTYMAILQDRVPDILILSPKMLYEAKASLESKQRLEITQNSEAVKLGHKTLSYEGLEIATEYGVPDAEGFLLSWDALELKSMQSQLVETATDNDISTSTDLIAMDAYLNLVIEAPSFLGKVAKITT